MGKLNESWQVCSICQANYRKTTKHICHVVNFPTEPADTDVPQKATGLHPDPAPWTRTNSLEVEKELRWRQLQNEKHKEVLLSMAVTIVSSVHYQLSRLATKRKPRQSRGT